MGLKQAPNAKEICAVSGKERLAKGEAKSLAKRWQPRDGGKVSAYRCNACRGWHVGNERKFG